MQHTGIHVVLSNWNNHIQFPSHATLTSFQYATDDASSEQTITIKIRIAKPPSQKGQPGKERKTAKNNKRLEATSGS